jgi:hypothetical protein
MNKNFDNIILSWVILTSALLPSCSDDNLTPKPIKFSELESRNIFGRMEVRLGQVASISGKVLGIDSGGFRLESTSLVENHIFDCKYLEQAKPIQNPEVGSTVIVTGFERLLHEGISNEAANYISIKRNVLDAAAGGESDIPGGAPSQIITQIIILDVRVKSRAKTAVERLTELPK